MLAWSSLFKYSMCVLLNIDILLAFSLMYQITSNKAYYSRYVIPPYDQEASLTQMYINYSAAIAFARVYALLRKNKKINTKQFVLALVFALASIPQRLVRLARDVILSEDDVRTNFIRVCWRTHGDLKYQKIEIVNNEIDINCGTHQEAIQMLLKNKIPREKIFKLVMELRRSIYDFKIRELALRKEEKLQYIKPEGVNWPSHFGKHENNVMFHATSTTPPALGVNQYVSAPIADLVKFGAKSPATIITLGVKPVYGNKSIIVPQHQVDSMRYSHPEIFPLSGDRFAYANDKFITFRAIFRSYGVYDDKLANWYASGNYWNELASLGDADLVSALDKDKWDGID